MILKIFLFASLVALAFGHGRLISPPGRSTMWRYGYKTRRGKNTKSTQSYLSFVTTRSLLYNISAIFMTKTSL